MDGSIDLENICVGHSDVANAAVISVPHEKWEERPIVIVQPMPGKSPAKEDFKNVYWQSCKMDDTDDVIFTDNIPSDHWKSIKKQQDQFGGHKIN